MKDGGPAFPHLCELIDVRDGVITTKPLTEGGMSLRDYFAAAALQGILSDQDSANSIWEDARSKSVPPTPYLANTCYLIADAMLAEREKS